MSGGQRPLVAALESIVAEAQAEEETQAGFRLAARCPGVLSLLRVPFVAFFPLSLQMFVIFEEEMLTFMQFCSQAFNYC